MSYEMPVDSFNLFKAVDSVNFNYDDGAVGPPVATKKLDESEAIDEIRRRLGCKYKNAYIPVTDLADEFILRFLRARKMRLDDSFQLLLRYFAFRKDNAALFENMNTNDQLIVQCIRDGLPTIFKNKDRKGRCVLFFMMHQWDRTKYSPQTLYRSLVLSLEYLLAEQSNQLFGFVFVVDWTNFTLRDYLDLSPKMLKLFVDGFQDSFPARIRNIHFIGQPWYVNGVLAAVKPFLKEKTKRKLIVHSSNLSTLYEYIPRDVASAELGGEGAAYGPDEWIELLADYEKTSISC